MPHVSPIRVLRKTRLWVPALALVVALVVLAIGLGIWRNAHQLEAHGLPAEAVVLARDIRERQDKEGRTRVSYSLSYRFQPAEGPQVQRRRDVSRRFFDSVAVGDVLTIRHLPQRPSVHELQIGDTRARAQEFLGVGIVALVLAVAMSLWLGLGAQPLLRALAGGRVRQARVTAHVPLQRRRVRTGRRYGRIRWCDETGAEGESNVVPMLDVLSHPVGSRIRVLVDPVTGRGYWEEELTDDTPDRWQSG